ncbi:MAG: AMP-binding protein [Candidatus Thiodiazotropha sp. (ex Semelilucina semeliformis)]|nr:AMP-binding protein [Candidatus Thiodiazotropha sp. (ex Semelilucina semeliformis)]
MASQDFHNGQYSASDNIADRLLGLVQVLVKELYPGRGIPAALTLDSSLDKDLGIDSLGRVELLVRLEKTFNLGLSDQAFAAADTPRELLHLILSATSASSSPAVDAVRPTVLESAAAAPNTEQTLMEVLYWHIGQHRDRPHIYLYDEDYKPTPINYDDLLQGAQSIAAGLWERELEPGQTVAIMLPTCKAYFFSFIGILLAGGIPVPIYPPARLSQIEDHLHRHARILDNARASVLITVAEAKPVARMLKSQVPGLRHIATPDDLALPNVGTLRTAVVQPHHTAFLQYTSGSTGNPKGVVLSHANLLANLRAMGEAAGVDSNDVFVSWLPLYHDMGLIGAWLGSLYFAYPLVLMSPLTFLNRPQRWLWAIHNHRGTLSAAPNFAYEICHRKICDEDVEGLDLSSWRMAFNGAEPVSPHTIRQFSQRYEKYGFRPDTMAPVYGLAESSVGLAFPPLHREPLIDCINHEALARSGRAVPVEPSDPMATEIVACGQPLRGHQVRVVDVNGRELPEREEGQLQFRGPSTTSGYYRNPDETRKLFSNGWVNTGDLAYMAGGDIFLTSRAKDIIIRGGRNIYPHEVEEAIGDMPGIRKGCVAVFGSTDPESGTERIVILAETREQEKAQRSRLEAQIVSLVIDMLGMPPDEVVLAEPHTVLKTSSGKIRRAASKASYEQGSTDSHRRAIWLQFSRLAVASLVPELRRAWRQVKAGLYAAYTWVVFSCMAPGVWLLTVLLPKLSWRWSLVKHGSNALRRLARVPLAVQGIPNLPLKGPCVLVVNHASYLDGILLVGVLPRKFRFVAKAELNVRLIPRLFLQRIGSLFVERFDRQIGAEDAQRLGRLAKSGESLLFFPEGTFHRMPGLLPFHLGAFIAAAQAEIPVVPIVIRGSRSILRSGSWFPRQGSLGVIIGKPVYPKGTDWTAAVKLRDQVREIILCYSGEPNLAGELNNIKD